MKLLVLAQTPPPVHGQSVMVRMLVEGLPQVAPHISVIHVNLGLSSDSGDIGRVRIGKIFRLWRACFRAFWKRLCTRGPVTLYYVPAPAKRSAIYRDWMVMFFLRPFFTDMVLHWHAVGLGEWLQSRAWFFERWLTQLALKHASLAIVLAPELADDARILAPQKIAIVPNGIEIPANAAKAATRGHKKPCRLLFLGQCSREKGLFSTLDAVANLQRAFPDGFALTVAGAFASDENRREFDARLANTSERLNNCVTHVGHADVSLKQKLYAEADIFVFPTRYTHEAQPLVVIEALAHDLPIVTTRWRAIPGMLPTNAHVQCVPPDAEPHELAMAIRSVRDAGPAHGALRAHYEKHFTLEAHLTALAQALRNR